MALREALRERIRAAPVNETMHMMFYEIVEKARRDAAQQA
jgi:hypothetical protein